MGRKEQKMSIVEDSNSSSLYDSLDLWQSLISSSLPARGNTPSSFWLDRSRQAFSGTFISFYLLLPLFLRTSLHCSSRCRRQHNIYTTTTTIRPWHLYCTYRRPFFPSPNSYHLAVADCPYFYQSLSYCAEYMRAYSSPFAAFKTIVLLLLLL